MVIGDLARLEIEGPSQLMFFSVRLGASLSLRRYGPVLPGRWTAGGGCPYIRWAVNVKNPHANVEECVTSERGALDFLFFRP